MQDADWVRLNRSPALAVNQSFRLEYPIGTFFGNDRIRQQRARLSERNRVAFATTRSSATRGNPIDRPHLRTQPTLTPLETEISGLAGNPTAKRLVQWRHSTVSRSTRSRRPSGNARLVASLPGGVPVIQGIARDGRVLRTDENRKAIAIARGPGEDRERDLLFETGVGDPHPPDGRQILVEEQGIRRHPGERHLFASRAMARRPFV